MSIYPFDEFPWPEAPLSPFSAPGTPPGEGSNPVEAAPVSQEAMIESEARIAQGATPYAIVDETALTEEMQLQAKQNPPFDHITPNAQMKAEDAVIQTIQAIEQSMPPGDG